MSTSRRRGLVDALRHIGLEHASVRWWGPAVNLSVVRVQMRMQRVISNQRHEIGDVENK